MNYDEATFITVMATAGMTNQISVHMIPILNEVQKLHYSSRMTIKPIAVICLRAAYRISALLTASVPGNTREFEYVHHMSLETQKSLKAFVGR
uniref:Uncharacterized protein n=1 Tax=Romanomermis culicivorax TaxID=13658 RepID=A0A915J3D3_ROMCU